MVRCPPWPACPGRARPGSRPPIGFVSPATRGPGSLRSRFCLRLPSDPASRRRPCPWLRCACTVRRHRVPSTPGKDSRLPSQRPCWAHINQGQRVAAPDPFAPHPDRRTLLPSVRISPPQSLFHCTCDCCSFGHQLRRSIVDRNASPVRIPHSLVGREVPQHLQPGRVALDELAVVGATWSRHTPPNVRRAST